MSGSPVFDTNTGQVVGLHQGTQTEQILNRVDPASYARPEVRNAILTGTELLADNPRQVKAFINVFRLTIYIANERKLLEERQLEKRIRGLGLEKMAVWVACSVRWSSLIRHLHSETQLDTFRVFLGLLSDNISLAYKWKRTGNVPTKKVKETYTKLRETEKSSEGHWCHLPWEWWLLELDFLKAVKMLKEFWKPPEGNETDWLKVLLTMTRTIS